MLTVYFKNVMSHMPDQMRIREEKLIDADIDTTIGCYVIQTEDKEITIPMSSILIIERKEHSNDEN